MRTVNVTVAPGPHDPKRYVWTCRVCGRTGASNDFGYGDGERKARQGARLHARRCKGKSQ